MPGCGQEPECGVPAGAAVPAVVIDDFFPPEILNRSLAEFPEVTEREMRRSQELFKGACRPDDLPLGAGFSRALFYSFNSQPFLAFLEEMSGIDGLIPDPYFLGGGFHETLSGGKLGIHADFNLHKKLRLRRRMNLLLYLNREWDSSWGGALELWTRDMKQRAREIQPLFNRCVVFNTDDTAYHGHPDPLRCPPEITRKSIALYYYTASDSILTEEKLRTTVFKGRAGSDDKFDYAIRLKYFLRDCLPPIVTRALSRLKNRSAK